TYHFFRVFKKSSADGKLSIYLAKRDYVDHVDHVEPVDGMILIDPEYQKDKKVFVTLTCTFRYGRDDHELIGLSFKKDLYFLHCQVYPPLPEDKKALTPLQEKLAKKLGQNAFPFCFNMATDLPCSVTLQPGPEDTGKKCGVDFEVKGFCAENVEEKNTGGNRHFSCSDSVGSRCIYYHGEPIGVNVKITNNTSKIVKKIKITVEQLTDVVLYSLDKYTKIVCCEEMNDTVAANGTFSGSYSVTPLLANNREKRGLALDGKLKHGDTNLASSTILRPGMDKEVLGMLVSYKVRVNLVVARGGYVNGIDVLVDLPLTLMHPKPSPGDIEDVVIEEFARQKLQGAEGEDDKEDA
uniref:Arrestin-C n=1 Tax=Xenopus tropicalis TaxID=8364 RepID=A0A6I8PKW9_XENTR